MCGVLVDKRVADLRVVVSLSTGVHVALRSRDAFGNVLDYVAPSRQAALQSSMYDCILVTVDLEQYAIIGGRNSCVDCYC